MSNYSLPASLAGALAVSVIMLGAAQAQTTTSPATGDVMKSAPGAPLPATPVPDQTAPNSSNGTGAAPMPMDHAPDPALSPSAGAPTPDAAASTQTTDSTATDGKKHKKHKKHPS